jgi:hypothetical protein
MTDDDLRREVERLRAELEQVTRWRDNALRDLGDSREQCGRLQGALQSLLDCVITDRGAVWIEDTNDTRAAVDRAKNLLEAPNG